MEDKLERQSIDTGERPETRMKEMGEKKVLGTRRPPSGSLLVELVNEDAECPHPHLTAGIAYAAVIVIDTRFARVPAHLELRLRDKERCAVHFTTAFEREVDPRLGSCGCGTFGRDGRYFGGRRHG